MKLHAVHVSKKINCVEKKSGKYRNRVKNSQEKLIVKKK